MEYGISPRQLALGVVSRVACPLPAVRLPLSPIRARANQVQRRRRMKQETKMAATRSSGYGAVTGSPAKRCSPAVPKGKPVLRQGEEPSPWLGHGHDPKSSTGNPESIPHTASPATPVHRAPATPVNRAPKPEPPLRCKGAGGAGISAAAGAVAHNPPARITPTASASRTPPNKLLRNGAAAVPLARESAPKELTPPIHKKVLPKTASPPRIHGEGSSHSLHAYSSHREYSAASTSIRHVGPGGPGGTFSAREPHHSRSSPPLKTWHSAGNLKPYAHEAAKKFFEREAQRVLPGKRGLRWQKGSSFWQQHPLQSPGCRPTTMTPTMPSGGGTGDRPSLFSTNFSHHSTGSQDAASPLSPAQ
ncbi:hypothetical protein CYMTET_46105, partial [Cymbomonas tetramitiformis]